MADYLSEEEQLDRLKTWWRQNGAGLLITLALALAAVLGWRWYDGARTEGRQAASELFEAYLAAEGEQREALAAQLDESAAGAGYQAFAFMRQAGELLEAGEVDAAAGLLKQVVEADLPSPLKDLAYVRLARLQQQQGDSEAALTSLAAVRGGGARWQVQELLGDIHLAQGERERAHEAYNSALAEVGADQQRPILEMKAHDTAPTPIQAAVDDEPQIDEETPAGEPATIDAAAPEQAVPAPKDADGSEEPSNEQAAADAGVPEQAVPVPSDADGSADGSEEP